MFGAWVVVSRDGMFVRLSDDEPGDALWPTEAEQEHAEKERERSEKERALARVGELEALLAQLRGKT